MPTHEWPEYETRKRVRAARICTAVVCEDSTTLSFLMVEAPGGAEQFTPTEPSMMKRVVVGDYALVYPDGFRSVNTKANFEATAVRVGEEPLVLSKLEYLWCAVRHDQVDISSETLQVNVTVSIRAFTTEQAARDWADAQPEPWSIVMTALDPDVNGGGTRQ